MANPEQAFVTLDGVPAGASATVSVFDRGFLYGDSVFETLRTYGGEPFALREHLERLEDGARQVGIAMPLDQRAFAGEIRAAVHSSGFAESYVRVMLTRGRALSLGLAPTLAGPPLRVVIVLPLELPSSSHYDDGIAAVTYRTLRIGEGTAASSAKLGNYLTAVLATEHARSRGAHEALLVDAHDRVLEGATSNLFGVTGRLLVTSPVELGVLPGITRARVLELAPAVGLDVELRAFRTTELSTFDELFVSSSIRELLSIVHVDDRPVGPGRPGPIYRRLLDEFRRAARIG
jgi:branched-chain amino acid aminotransferase